MRVTILISKTQMKSIKVTTSIVLKKMAFTTRKRTILMGSLALHLTMMRTWSMNLMMMLMKTCTVDAGEDEDLVDSNIEAIKAIRNQDR